MKIMGEEMEFDTTRDAERYIEDLWDRINELEQENRILEEKVERLENK